MKLHYAPPIGGIFLTQYAAALPLVLSARAGFAPRAPVHFHSSGKQNRATGLMERLPAACFGRTNTAGKRTTSSAEFLQYDRSSGRACLEEVTQALRVIFLEEQNVKRRIIK